MRRDEWRRSRGGEPPRQIRDIKSLVGVLDGRHGIGLATGVSQWADQRRQPFAWDYENLFGATQPAWSGVSVDGDGVDDTIASTCAKSDERILHDGTGSSLAIVFETGGTVITGSLYYVLGNGLNPGVQFFVDAVGVLHYRVQNASSQICEVVTGVLSGNTRYACLVRFSAAELNMQVDDDAGGSVVLSAVPSGVPDPGSAVWNITMLSNVYGNRCGNLKIFQARLFSGVLSPGDGAVALRELKGIVGGFAL